MPQHKTFPLGNLRGTRRLYTRVTDEFHQLVTDAARQQGLSTQDYVLSAVRDRVASAPIPSEENHHHAVQAIQAALRSHKTPPHLKDAIHSFVDWLNSSLRPRRPT